MADIIETHELPVIITKVRIGKKDLSEKLIKQLPLDNYVYYFEDIEHSNEVRIRWGLPSLLRERTYQLDNNIEDSEEPKRLMDKKYFVDGTLIGYIEIKSLGLPQIIGHITHLDKERETDVMTTRVGRSLNRNFSGKFYHIIWYTKEGKLKKGYIDKWTIDQLGIKLEQIFI